MSITRDLFVAPVNWSSQDLVQKHNALRKRLEKYGVFFAANATGFGIQLMFLLGAFVYI